MTIKPYLVNDNPTYLYGTPVWEAEVVKPGATVFVDDEHGVDSDGDVRAYNNPECVFNNSDKEYDYVALECLIPFPTTADLYSHEAASLTLRVAALEAAAGATVGEATAAADRARDMSNGLEYAKDALAALSVHLERLEIALGS